MQYLYHNRRTSSFRNFDQVNFYIYPNPFPANRSDRAFHRQSKNSESCESSFPHHVPIHAVGRVIPIAVQKCIASTDSEYPKNPSFDRRAR